MDHARDRAYVIYGYAGFVTVVDVAAMTVEGNVSVSDPTVMALGPGGDELYVGSGVAQSITVIDLNTRTVISETPTPASYPGGLAFAPGAPLKLYALTSTNVDGPAFCVLQVTP